VGQRIAFSQFFGQHGYLPDLVDLEHSVNMHATFVAAGPGIRKQSPVAGIRAIDVAPTVAYLLGIQAPANARGSILVNLTTKPNMKVYTILNISDYHAQLTPLAEAADNVTGAGAANPTFPIGGAAFLKPWFDVYRAQAANGSLTFTGGDSFGGATPPISNFFDDVPGVEALNLMGVNAEALGNHSFDRGEQFLRNELIPLADFDMISANVVFPNGTTPPEWTKSVVYNLDGAKIGVIGFTTEDTPDLIFPGNLGPFEVRPVLPAINDEAERLKDLGVNTIIAVGHEGATGGTLFLPTGPLIDIADGATNIDVVMGDHNDQQVDAVRPNGVLVTENRGKGIRFTRVTLVVDPTSKAVVYKTADFHLPWNIGVTPDPAIQAMINELNAALQPILGTQIG
jgi:2',3'-cyclic-nucleotide 2'-phosphodiesterase (5'-nucleotidase family)